MMQLLSVREAAKLLGISKVAIIKQIKAGKIKAVKVGNSYVIDKDDLTIISEKTVSGTQKIEIEEAVDKTIAEYSEALKLLKNA